MFVGGLAQHSTKEWGRCVGALRCAPLCGVALRWTDLPNMLILRHLYTGYCDEESLDAYFAQFGVADSFIMMDKAGRGRLESSHDRFSMA